MDQDALTEEHQAWEKAKTRRWAVRLRHDRLVGGLASGLGRHWGIPVAYVRAAFVVAAFAAGAGVVAYLIGWALTLERDEEAAAPEPKSSNQKSGLVLMYIGGLVVLRGLDLWPDDTIVFGAALLAFGTAAMWDRSDAEARGKIAKLTGAGDPEVTRIRVIAGGLLMLAGFFFFVGSIDALADLGPVLV